jgi:hypothetical protein
MAAPDLAFKLNRTRFTDISTLATFISNLSLSKAVTVNEIREILSPLYENGLDRIDGGDDLFIDVGGFPTRLSEIFPPEKRGTKRHTHYGHKFVDYDDIDFDTYEEYQQEYINAKDSKIIQAQRIQKNIIDETSQDLIKTFDKMLKAAFRELNKQAEKSFSSLFGGPSKGWKQGGLNINPIIRAVESNQIDLETNLKDAYSKSLIQGAMHSARQVGAEFRIDGKCVDLKDQKEIILEIPDADIVMDFSLRNPRVERYVREQAERISKNITKTMSNRIRRQLLKGIEKGETNQQIAERLKNAVGIPGLRDSSGRLLTSKTRALLIARTEVADSFNIGTLEGYKATDGVVQRVIIRDGNDFDTACSNANGEEWTFSKAEENSLEHPNCLIGSSLVFASNVEAVFLRRFDGEVVILRTAANDLLTCTPNHPIWTDRGWLAAGDLCQGDYVIRSLDGKRISASLNPNNDKGPARIEDITASFLKSRSVTTRVMPSSAEHFHCDGIGSHVYVVGADRLARNKVKAPLGKHFQESPFNVGLMGASALLTKGSAGKVFDGSLNSSDSIVRLSGDSEPIIGTHFRHTKRSRLRSGSQLVTTTAKRPAQTSAVNSDGMSDLIRSLSGLVAPIKLIEVGRRPFVGHVYNLETKQGWYIADGIITHNCTRIFIPKVSSD